MTAHNVFQYNVTWTEPGRNPYDSMPLGNGELGANVYLNPDGELLLYLARTDTFSENNRLLKIGRLRIHLEPHPLATNEPVMQQTLHLEDGAVRLTLGPNGQAVRLRVWVDAHHPVVRVGIDADQPVSPSVKLDVWRTERRAIDLNSNEAHSARTWMKGPENPIVEPDTIEDVADALVWHHRNERSMWADQLERQGLLADAEALGLRDPLLHRTFGGRVEGPGLSRPEGSDPTRISAVEPRAAWSIRTTLHTAITPTHEEWRQQIDALAWESADVDEATAWRQHAAWWAKFWNRSWIEIDGPSEAFTVARGYAIQRFMLACAGRGKFPVKFNGSLFTVEGGPEKWDGFDADYRRWGGCYWFQNTRLAYWAMIAAGDFDLIRPLFTMYRAAQSLGEARTHRYFGHHGVTFPETMHFWGTLANPDYGWDREGLDVGEIVNPFIRYYWQGMLELISLGLTAYDHGRDETLLRDQVLPLAESILRFYDEHYPRDDKTGRIRFEPASSLETWHQAVNPTPEIAGLRRVCSQLQGPAWPHVGETIRELCIKLIDELPPLPIGEQDGELFIQPAADYTERKNMENPELYAVWPYRQVVMGQDPYRLAMGRCTFEKRIFRLNKGWDQDGIQAACLGLTDAARAIAVHKFSTWYEHSRFPGMFGPNFDWTPDQDHGCTAMLTLQHMLLQSDGETLHLLPAWPADWSVRFKLHAGDQTTVQGEYRDGKLVALEVDPPHRTADLERTVQG